MQNIKSASNPANPSGESTPNKTNEGSPVKNGPLKRNLSTSANTSDKSSTTSSNTDENGKPRRHSRESGSG